MSKVTIRCSLMGVEASVSDVMNCKHLHYSRKPARLKDGEEGKENECPALKLATRDLTCYEGRNNTEERKERKKNSLTANLPSRLNPLKQQHKHTCKHTLTHTHASSSCFI